MGRGGNESLGELCSQQNALLSREGTPSLLSRSLQHSALRETPQGPSRAWPLGRKSYRIQKGALSRLGWTQEQENFSTSPKGSQCVFCVQPHPALRAGPRQHHQGTEATYLCTWAFMLPVTLESTLLCPSASLPPQSDMLFISQALEKAEGPCPSPVLQEEDSPLRGEVSRPQETSGPETDGC